MPKFVATVTRTTYAVETIEVEAETEEQAYDIAEAEACNAVWPKGTAEYEVEHVDPAEEEE